MPSGKHEVSGSSLDGRLVKFLRNGDVWVQGINQKADRVLLPEFSMWPTLAATAFLGAVIAWYGFCSCRLLGEVARAEREKAAKTSFQQEVVSHSVANNSKIRMARPVFVPGMK